MNILTVQTVCKKFAHHYLIFTPVLYTVGLKATFWNMNCSVWAVLAAYGENKIEYF